jgi:hypothetical protein
MGPPAGPAWALAVMVTSETRHMESSHCVRDVVVTSVLLVIKEPSLRIWIKWQGCRATLSETLVSHDCEGDSGRACSSD